MILLSLFSISSIADNLTTEELKQAAVKIKSTENKLINIKIESEVWVEQKMSKADPCESWQNTVVHVSCTGWFDGANKDKGRIDFHREALRWIDGASDYIERSYSVGFDGQYGRKVFHTRGFDNKIKELKKCEKLAEVPEALISGTSMTVTGGRFTLFFSSPGNSDLKWSEFFQLAADKHTIMSSAFKFSRENFQNSECVKVSAKKTGWEESYWLDPARGFALLGRKSTGSYEDGSERLVAFIKVTQLKEVADGLWWPTEATVESDPFKPGQEPYLRTVYRCSNVIANDPNFDESVFTVPFPDGYMVDDKVTGRKYKVGD